MVDACCRVFQRANVHGRCELIHLSKQILDWRQGTLAIHDRGAPRGAAAHHPTALVPRTHQGFDCHVLDALASRHLAKGGEHQTAQFETRFRRFVHSTVSLHTGQPTTPLKRWGDLSKPTGNHRLGSHHEWSAPTLGCKCRNKPAHTNVLKQRVHFREPWVTAFRRKCHQLKNLKRVFASTRLEHASVEAASDFVRTDHLLRNGPTRARFRAARSGCYPPAIGGAKPENVLENVHGDVCLLRSIPGLGQ